MCWLLSRAMREFDETAEDLRAAFDDLRAAGGEEPRQRRALKAVLNELYRVQEYRCGRDKVNKQAYAGAGKSPHDRAGRPRTLRFQVSTFRREFGGHVTHNLSPSVRSAGEQREAAAFVRTKRTAPRST